jgi:hypothetical protein
VYLPHAARLGFKLMEYLSGGRVKCRADRVERDNYPTPFCAVAPLMEKEDFPGLVWEPACGSGYIVTNPPYKLADKFLLHSAKCATKSALLLRLSFLESQKRQILFKSIPLYKVYIMTNRLPFWTPDGWCKSGGQFCHAWFVLDHNRYDGETKLGWLVPSGGIEP